MRLREITAEGIALLVPPRCAICGQGCPATTAICGDCRLTLSELPLGAVLPGRRSAFDYSGIARQAVHALKFEARPALAVDLARLMRSRLPPEWFDAVTVVPVPPHPLRSRQRGYNQSLLLAKTLAELTGTPVLDCLERTPGARPQSTLSRAQRLNMARDAVRYRRRGYRHLGRRTSAQFPTNVLVCDDVATTGVTLEVCAEVLRESHPDLTLQIRAVTFASTGAQTSQSAQKNTGHG